MSQMEEKFIIQCITDWKEESILKLLRSVLSFQIFLQKVSSDHGGLTVGNIVNIDKSLLITVSKQSTNFHKFPTRKFSPICVSSGRFRSIALLIFPDDQKRSTCSNSTNAVKHKVSHKCNALL